MYIKYNDRKYPCLCSPNNDTISYRGLPGDFPSPVDGEIILCADDGFIMRMDNTANYLRQIFSNGVLTLTNLPESTIPPSSSGEYVATLEERVATLEEENAKLESQITDTQLALCEVYEMML